MKAYFEWNELKDLQNMKKQTIKYKDVDLGEIRIVDDFLPKPKDLVLKEETIKVTLSLSKSSVAFFKRRAKRHHSQYQKMIRVLLDAYAQHYEQDKTA